MARHTFWVLLLALGCGGKSQDQETHQELPDPYGQIDRHCDDCTGEPPACDNPNCERPMSSAAGYGLPYDVRGTCADGKTLEATLNPLMGHISYFRNGTLVGEALYTSTIGDCACSGESFAGDAACLSPTFDPPQTGEVRLPFADGHRSAPCACVD